MVKKEQKKAEKEASKGREKKEKGKGRKAPQTEKGRKLNLWRKVNRATVSALFVE